jgi:hypothetical protein
MSLEYSMFRFADDFPTAETIGEMALQVCMQDFGDDYDTDMIRGLVNAAYACATKEYVAEHDESDDFDLALPQQEVAAQFLRQYERTCKGLGEFIADGDQWWEDWWPTDCQWTKDLVSKLARLKAGQTQAVRRQLRAEFAKHKEASA